VTQASASFRRVVAALTVVLSCATAGGGAQAPQVASLLSPAPGAAVPDLVATRVDTLQARPVSVNTAALSATRLDIELTGGRVVRAVLDRRDTHRGGAETWAGHVEGEPLSSVTLVTSGGVLQGSVRLLDGAYSIEPSAGGPLHLVRLVDVDAVGGDLEPVVAVPELPASGDPVTGGDDASTFDVLVMYTADARTVAGGTDLAVQARIALGVSETNTAYANSGITPRLRLVGAELTNYVESGDLGVDLDRFRNTSDGQMDEVHTRRDALGADLAVLVVGATAGGACGVGYVMTSLSAGFAPWAFSVSAYPCISPNYTFAHELGHNMGSAHAPEDGSGQPSLYAFSFGYKDPAQAFRTVMAYNCSSGCPRVLHFSNPSVNYGGAATGTSIQHDNARSINQAASTIANWRQAVGGGTTPTISSIADVAIGEDGATPAIAFTVGDAETAPASLLVSASSSNTTLVPNTSGALSFGGSGASRTLTVTPAANRSGTSTISVTVSDGSLSATETFVLTVTSVNDAPTVTRSPVSGTIANGLVAHTTVTITDIDTAGSSLTLSGSSSNTTLLPNGGIGVSVTNTTAGSRTFDVAMTAAPGQSGSATVTLTGSDGVATVPVTYALTVTVPVPPTIGAVAPQATPEDVGVDVAFGVNDADTPLDSLLVTAVSSNAALVPPANVVLSGSGTSRSVRLTPLADQSGTSTITPTFAAGVPSAISTVTATPTSFPVTVHDIDTAGNALTLTGSSTNTTLLNTGGISIVAGASTASSRTFTVTVTPLDGATGTTTLGLLAEDATSPVGRAVAVSVTSSPAAPDAPTTLAASLSGSTLTLTWTAPTTGSTPTSFEAHVGTAPGTTTLPVQTTSGTSIPITLPAGGTYYARVKSVNGYGTGLPSPEVSVTAVAPNPRPGPPQNLTASFVGRTITITWGAPVTGSPATGYTLEVGTAPGLANLVVVPVGAALAFSAGGVPDGTFWIRVRGVNAAGSGAPSSDVGFAVTSAGGCVGLPLAPTFQAPVVSGNNVSLAWTAPTGGATPVSYVLSAGTGSGRSDIATFDLGGPALGFATGAPSGTYVLRVAARSACGVGPVSNEATAVVGNTGVVPVAPTGVTASAAGGVVTLQWTAPATGAAPTSYVIEAGTAAGAMNLGQFNTGSTATSISGPVPAGRYYLRVRTRAGTLVSPPSADAVVVVP
jgi:hypothetical protein